MNLPHLARNAVRYDATHHVVHAVDWHGTACQLQTPAELQQALADLRCYAAHAVLAAGVALCHGHGVDPQVLPLISAPAWVSQLSQQPARAFPGALTTALQRLDRANERAARLAMQLCANDDTLVIVDADGLFAQSMLRILAREPDMPVIQVIHLYQQPAIPPHTSIALVVDNVDDAGYTPDRLIFPDIPHYVVASQGPHPAPTPAPAVQYHAVVTARGIYRPDRVTQYYRDGDVGSDIIALG